MTADLIETNIAVLRPLAQLDASTLSVLITMLTPSAANDALLHKMAMENDDAEVRRALAYMRYLPDSVVGLLRQSVKPQSTGQNDLLIPLLIGHIQSATFHANALMDQIHICSNDARIEISRHLHRTILSKKERHDVAKHLSVVADDTLLAVMAGHSHLPEDTLRALSAHDQKHIASRAKSSLELLHANRRIQLAEITGETSDLAADHRLLYKKDYHLRSLEEITHRAVEELELRYGNHASKYLPNNESWQQLSCHKERDQVDKDGIQTARAGELIVLQDPFPGDMIWRLMHHVECDKGSVLIISPDMQAEMIVLATISNMSNVDIKTMQSGQITSEQWKRIADSVEQLYKGAISMVCDPWVRLEDIRSHCRNLLYQSGQIKMIVVGAHCHQTTQQELKQVAMEFAAPVTLFVGHSHACS